MILIWGLSDSSSYILAGAGVIWRLYWKSKSIFTHVWSLDWDGLSSRGLLAPSVQLACTSSQHESLRVVRVSRVDVPRDQGGSCKPSDGPLETMHHHFHCILLILWEPIEVKRREYMRAWVLWGIVHWETIFGEHVPHRLNLQLFSEGCPSWKKRHTRIGLRFLMPTEVTFQVLFHLLSGSQKMLKFSCFNC